MQAHHKRKGSILHRNDAKHLGLSEADFSGESASLLPVFTPAALRAAKVISALSMQPLLLLPCTGLAAL